MLSLFSRIALSDYLISSNAAYPSHFPSLTALPILTSLIAVLGGITVGILNVL